MLDQCPHCHKTYVTTRVQAGRCPMCGVNLEAENKDNFNEVKGLSDYSPLMENTDLAVFPRFWGTLAQILLKPTLFFEYLATQRKESDSSDKAFLFGVWVLFLGQSVSAFWLISMSGRSLETVFQGTTENALLGALLGDGQQNLDSQQLAYFIHLATVQAHLEFVLAPLVAFFAIHLVAGGCHFLGRSLQDRDETPPPYDLTLRWVAYAQAPFIFAMVPSLGGLVATGWTSVLLIRGLIRFHNIGFARALITVLSIGLLLKVFWSSALHRVSLHILLLFFPHLG